MAEERREKAERARQDAEELRIGAEREREDHEIRRRVAEGGPDQHVPREIGEVSPPGRWERDIERGEADAQRDEAISTIYERVTKLFALRVAAVIALPLLIICVFLWRATEENGQAKVALCALKVDLDRRADQSQKLLDENPGDPVMVFGLSIPRAQLQTSLAGQRSTLDALAPLKCDLPRS